MNSFYLYSFKYIQKEKPSDNVYTATVIFCSCEEINEKDLQLEIRTFYQNHYQPDKIFILGSNRIVTRLQEVFMTNQDKTFKGIPKRQEVFLHDNLYLLSFDKDGNLSCENGKEIPKGFEESFRNEGLQQIFICRGGLIVSESSHHYVFPSGKHCDRFLRTGNILLYSPEIYFIAFCLLRHFNEEHYTRIYCDTSSINSIAYALFDLKNNFLGSRQRISIESFSSYDGLYKNAESYTKDSFLLISASTSSNIVKYVLDKHRILERDNIVILYFHGADADFSNVKDQVLCNLTKSEKNENGIDYYPTYLEVNCEFCKRGSYPVPVAGDVFLLEKPRINKIILSINDREKDLSNFVQQFMAEKKENCVFKSHFKERSENKYEVYIDFAQILKSMTANKRMEKFRRKLDDYISQYLPANTLYMVHLNDEGSEQLGKFILREITPRFKEGSIPKLIDQENLITIPKDINGTVVVIGSCISNGKNLLYISRALRKYDKLKIVYFIGIARTANKDYLKNLMSNLKRGKYGSETNGFVPVETMFCSSNSKATPWIRETEFLKEIILFINDRHSEFTSSIDFFEKRKKFLEDGSGTVARGISEDLFFPRITTTEHEKLKLRKNFAFFDFEDYVDDVTQADVYFTLSNIINSLRNSEKAGRQLKQAVYVRTLIDPHNFSRFNDGVIQSSILRAASADELAYAIDNELSLEMFNTLDTIIQYHTQEQGEALVEFLYAIAIKKLTLARSHLVELLARIEEFCKIELFLCLQKFIQEKLIDEPLRLRTEPFAPSGKKG